MKPNPILGYQYKTTLFSEREFKIFLEDEVKKLLKSKVDNNFKNDEIIDEIRKFKITLNLDPKPHKTQKWPPERDDNGELTRGQTYMQDIAYAYNVTGNMLSLHCYYKDNTHTLNEPRFLMKKNQILFEITVEQDNDAAILNKVKSIKNYLDTKINPLNQYIETFCDDANLLQNLINNEISNRKQQQQQQKQKQQDKETLEEQLKKL